MKIIQINGNAFRGSTGKIVWTVSSYLKEQGIESKIICSGFFEEKSLPEVKYVSNKTKKKIHQILAYIFGDAGFHSSFTTKKVIKIIEEENPDIVHLHHLEGYFINVQMLLRFLKKKNIKTVWTLHDCWPITGHCTHFLTANCNKWKTCCEKCPQKRKYPYSLIFDRSRKLYLLKKRLMEDWRELNIVNVSKWMDSIVKDSFLAKHPSRVIYNGIDISVFKPGDTDYKAELGFAGKRIVLGVANSWSEGKGLDVFLKLAGVLNKNTIIVLVGMNREQINKLPSGIIGVLRTQSQEQLRKYYCAADVFLNLSMEETMGLVTVEALACGTPVIVCNSSASPELVGEGCGTVLKNRAVSEIVSAIDEIGVHGKDYYSENARRFVLENFSQEKMKENYFALYNEIGKRNE